MFANLVGAWGSAARILEVFGMAFLKRFLFGGAGTAGGALSLGLLVLRLAFSVALMTHGFAKFRNFGELSGSFADPLGFGSGVALSLAVFAELFCPVAVALGLLERLAVLPILVTMAFAFFGVHGGSLAKGETPFLHLAAFAALFVSGPGKYSLDALLGKRLRVK